MEQLEDRTLLAPVALQNATATNSANGGPIAGAIDGNAATAWAIASTGLDSTLSESAAFETGADVNFAKTKLTFRLFSGDTGGVTLGLFRLSITTDDRTQFADGLGSEGDVTANWTQLVPSSATARVANSSGNPIAGPLPTLTIRPDNSILAGGPNPNFVLYTVTATTTLTGITGVRLEVIDDDSTALPTGGPGRELRGNFGLREFNVDAQPVGAQIGDFVWHDSDGDGRQDAGEPGIGGESVLLFDSDGELVVGTITDATGKYLFTAIDPGSYRIQVDAVPGFAFTAKDEGNDLEDSDVDSATGLTDLFTVDENTIDLDRDAGMYMPSSVHAQKFHDKNANGVQDPGEEGMDGWTMMLTGTDNASNPVSQTQVTMSMDIDGSGSDAIDNDGDGQIDEPDEAIDPETESGVAWFMNLAPGTYSVSEQPLDGWEQSTPAGGTYNVVLNSGETEEELDFGNYQRGSIHGQKWNDLNANGVKDPGEPGMDGWKITYNKSNPDGTFVFAVTTTMSMDLDGSGSNGIDDDGDGQIDEPDEAIDPETESGLYWTNLPPGHWTISETQQPGWKRSAPNNPEVLFRFEGVISDVDLDSAAPLGPPWENVSVGDAWSLEYKFDPAAVDSDGSSSIGLYADAITAYLLTIGSATDFGPGTGYSIEVKNNVPEDIYGVFPEVQPVGSTTWFLGLLDAAALVFSSDALPQCGGIDVAQFGWKSFELESIGPSASSSASGPVTVHQCVPPGSHFVQLTSGEVVEGRDFGNFQPNFGNFQPASIHGQKFHDTNGDQEQNFGEPGIDGWKITLTGFDENGNPVSMEQLTMSMDLDGDGVIDPEREQGLYWFTNLLPGIYVVEEGDQPGWMQTTPAGSFHKFAFGGELYDRQPVPNEDIEPPLWVDAEAGDRWSVLYQFDPTVSDGEPDPVRGFYQAITGYRLDIGGAVEQAAVDALQTQINVANDEAADGDAYGASGLLGIPALSQDSWGVALFDGTAQAFSSDALPLCGEFDFAAFGSGNFGTSRAAESGVAGTVDSHICGGPGSHVLALGPGQVSDGNDFGNFQFATFSGQKFEDSNGNGQRDSGEPGLDGWLIELLDARTGEVIARMMTASVDSNGDGMIDAEREAGRYEFAGLPLGDYLVHELLPAVLPPEPPGAMSAGGIPFGPPPGMQFFVSSSGPAGPTPEIKLGDLDGTNGYRFVGTGPVAVAPLGDTNGDGFDDLLVGDSSAASAAGRAYVVFGDPVSLATLDLADGTSDGTLTLANVGAGNGFAINGIAANDSVGSAVSSMGDVNGDGLADLALFAPGANAGAGESYLVFGDAGGYGGLALLGTGGFVFRGACDGTSVAAGDVNGDGFTDLLLGSHLVFGGMANLDMDDLADGTDDGVIDLSFVPAPGGARGFLVKNVCGAAAVPGDYDGDGFSDLLIGTTVIFGGMAKLHSLDLADGNDGEVDAALVDGTNGATFSGGVSVRSAGDINGDARADLMFGVPFDDLDPALNMNEGRTFVFFGRPAGAWPATFDLNSLLAANGGDGSNGFVLNGVIESTTGVGTRLGTSVSAAGDVNGDGFDDLLAAGEGDGGSPGETYVVFGHAGAFGAELDAGNLGSGGLVVRGIPGERVRIVRGGGDANGDGSDDFMVAGFLPQGYVVFGADFSSAVTHSGDATCTAGADVMIGDASDNVIVGAGGPDVLRGGAGEDVLAISDLTFARIVGGRGTDTLRLDGSGHHLNLTAVPDSRILGIERIDITGASPNTLTMHLLDVLNLSDDSNTVVVIGDADDHLNLFGGFTPAGTELIDGATFAVFTHGEAVVKVSDAVSLTVPVGSVSASDLLAAAGGNGGAGFVLNGVAAGDQSGVAVSSAGDVNGDGFDDVLIGAPEADPPNNLGGPIPDAGQSYLVYGRGDFTATPELELATLEPGGFRIGGLDPSDRSGSSVSSAGDTNGDGLDDLLIGAPFGDAQNNSKPDAGEAYLVLGQPGMPVTFGPASVLNGIEGAPGLIGEQLDQAGNPVRSAGDVNGDGFTDLLIRAGGGDGFFESNPDAGECYIVFGGPHLSNLDALDGPDNQLDLSKLDGVRGFLLNGVTGGLRSISGGGDFNGDGYSDLLIAAPFADGSNGTTADAGEVYIVFGGPHLEALEDSVFAGNIQLQKLLASGEGDGTHGLVIFGAAMNHRIGQSISFAGDVNGDGFDDVVIGGPEVPAFGQSYVVFGHAGGLGPELNVADIVFGDGSLGFAIDGPEGASSGLAVSGLGDVNGDGFDDLAIGAPFGGANIEGEVHVLLGRAAGFDAIVSLDALDGLTGYKIVGAAANDRFGSAIGGGGDVNGDGFDDLVIGAHLADPVDPNDPNGATKDRAGQTFVVFGHDHTFSVTHSGNATGTAGADVMIGDAGDNVIVGAGGPDVLRGGAGNDVLAISDLTFQRIAGGNGTDTLRLDGSGMTLDLTATPDNRILGIERIDITGASPNTLVAGRLDVLNLSDHSNTLLVCGDSDDTAILAGGGWLLTGTATTACGEADVYQSAAAIVQVAQAVQVITPDPAVVELADLVGVPGIDGYVFRGVGEQQQTGGALAGGHDINGDGFHDLLIGRSPLPCPGTCDSPPPPNVDEGSAFFIFGGKSSLALLDDVTDEIDNGTISFSTSIWLAGYTAVGADIGDRAGNSVRIIDDVSGDGTPDLLIGANLAPPHCVNDPATPQNECAGIPPLSAGKAYLLFGEELPTLAQFVSSTLTLPLEQVASFGGSVGYEFQGINSFDTLGDAVAGIGDINGDGIGDLAISARGGDAPGANGAGQTFVVFGGEFNLFQLDKAQGDPVNGVIKLASLANQPMGTRGFVINGKSPDDVSGVSISAAGDVNGDGIADLLIGAFGADRDGDADAGEAYVVFGTDQGFPSVIELDSLGDMGFTIRGISAGDNAGVSVSGGGDVNSDGFDDIVIGAPGADRGGMADAGAAYIVYGFDNSAVAAVDLAALGTAGVALRGVAAGDRAGTAVSIVGDWNGDGFDDVLVGAPGADPNFTAAAGESYVVFGAATLPATLDLANLNGFNGRVIRGIAVGDGSGRVVSAAGDVDGDGFDDLLIGAPLADANTHTDSGESYLLFGGDFTHTATHLGDNAANMLIGTAGDDIMIGGQGDDLLSGVGGVDVLRGGQGNDVLTITDDDLRKIVGGTGFDILMLDTSGMFFNLEEVANNRIRGIEQIDGTGMSPNVVRGGLYDFLHLINNADTFTGGLGSFQIVGDADDQVNLVGDAWMTAGTRMVAGKVFNVYRHPLGVPPLDFGPTAVAGVDPSPSIEVLVSADVLTIIEEVPPDWVQTYPRDIHRVTVDRSGQVEDGLDFGNFRPGFIQGQAFADLDADGMRDPGEPGLHRRTIQLFDAGTGRLVAEQPTQHTDLDGNGRLETGRYSFPGLPAGQYFVRQSDQPGWKQTLPELAFPGIAQLMPSTMSLEVKEYSGDFESWVDSRFISEPASLDLRFHWQTYFQTSLNGFDSVRYEVSRVPFPQLLSDPPLSIDAANTINATPAWFDLDFTPIVNLALGTTQVPQQPVTFYMRLVARDDQGNYIGQPSNTVTIVYGAAPPSQPLVFDSMLVRLASVKCIDETDGEGGDSDEIFVRVFVTDLSVPMVSQVVGAGSPELDDMDDGEMVAVNTDVVNYSGLGYLPDQIVILAVVMEDDSDDFFTSLESPFGTLDDRLAFYQSVSGLTSSQIGTFLLQDAEDAANQWADDSGDDRIGPVQRLHLTGGDWQKILNGQNVPPKKLTFSGDGGLYELTFEIVADPTASVSTSQQALETSQAAPTAPRGTYPVSITESGQAFAAIDFGSVKLNAIHGRVFEDLDGDGQMDRGEPGVAGRMIQLDIGDDATVDASAVTDADGRYAFRNLLPGRYAVQIVTSDNEYSYSTVQRAFVFLEGSIHEGLDFGVFEPGEIAGQKFHDRNGNGRRDQGDEAIAGVTIELSGVDGLGRQVRRTTETDESGFYQLNDISPGNYTVGEQVQPGFIGTFPGFEQTFVFSGEITSTIQNIALAPPPAPWDTIAPSAPWELSYTFSINPLDLNTDSLFGEYLAIGEYTLTVGSVTATKSATKSQPSLMPGLIDVAVFIPEHYRVTDALPAPAQWFELLLLNNFNLDALSSDTLPLCGDIHLADFEFRELSIVVNAFVMHGSVDFHNCDFSRRHRVDVDSGFKAKSLDFGNAQPVTIRGQHFHDRDGDGQKEPGEPGLPGWEVVLLDVTTGRIVAHTTTGQDGEYSFDNLKPGTYRPELTRQQGWELTRAQDEPIPAPSGSDIRNADFASVQLGAIRGVVFEDLDGDGQKGRGELGVPGETILLDAGDDGRIDATAVSDPDGQYAFPNLLPGPYAVQIVPASDSEWVYPAVSRLFIFLESSIDQGIDWPVFEPGTIAGQKFNDGDGNGRRDMGEEGIAGVSINLTGIDGLGRQVSMTTRTDQTGHYELTDLWPGDYVVSEVPDPGSIPSYPFKETFVFGGLITSTAHIIGLAPVIPEGVNPGTPWSLSYTFDVLLNDISPVPWLGFYQQSTDYTLTLGSVTLKGPGTFPLDIQVNDDTPGDYSDTPDDAYLAYGNLNLPASEFILSLFDATNLAITSDKLPVCGDLELSDFATRELNVNFQSIASVKASVNYLTCNNDGRYLADVSSGALQTKLDFGNIRLATIRGRKFEDQNGDGIMNSGEPGLSGWTIVARGRDALGNRVEYSTVSQGFDANGDGQISSDEDGYYQMNNVMPGFYGIGELPQPDWFSPSLVSRTFTFGGSIDVVADSAALPHPWSVSAGDEWSLEYSFSPLAADRDPSNSYGVYENISHYTLTISGDTESGATNSASTHILVANNADHVGDSSLDRYSVWVPLQNSGSIGLTLLESDAQVFTSDALPLDCAAFFLNITDFEDVDDPGGVQAFTSIYEVRAMQAVLNGPADGVVYGTIDRIDCGDGDDEIIVYSGEVVDGPNLGNFQGARLSGQKFHDQDGDGVKDATEPGLPNWPIHLDLGSDGTLDMTTETDANGHYSFAGVPPGTHRISEATHPVFVQTLPAAPGTYTVPVTVSGSNLTGLDFGSDGAPPRLERHELVTDLRDRITGVCLIFSEPLAQSTLTLETVQVRTIGRKPKNVAIQRIDFGPDPLKATLQFQKAQKPGTYELMISDRVTDRSGLRLDGNRDGVPGGDLIMQIGSNGSRAKARGNSRKLAVSSFIELRGAGTVADLAGHILDRDANGAEGGNKSRPLSQEGVLASAVSAVDALLAERKLSRTMHLEP